MRLKVCRYDAKIYDRITLGLSFAIFCFIGGFWLRLGGLVVKRLEVFVGTVSKPFQNLVSI